MSLFSTLQVSASGMSAQRARAELLVENMANSETTRTPEGGPYHRKDVVFSTDMRKARRFPPCFRTKWQNGVAVSDVIEDQRDPEMRYLPGHPDANADGYVAYPRMNPAEDMVDLLNASRSYQANVAAISSVKDMISRSIDIMR